jgi:hypothetical protein
MRCFSAHSLGKAVAKDPVKHTHYGVLLRRCPNLLIASLALIAGISLINTPGVSAQDAREDTLQSSNSLSLSGSGQSYWGHIPVPSDSVTARATKSSYPEWEYALLVPYRILSVPFLILREAIKQPIIYSDEHYIIDKVAKLIGPQRGPFGVALRFQAGGLTGFGGGLTATHEDFLAPGNRLKLRWKSTVKGSHKVTLGVHFQRELPLSYVVALGYRLRPNARYFGLGPQAGDSMETFYSQEVRWAGAALRKRLSTQLYVEGMALLSAVAARAPYDSDDIPIDELFDTPPVGYDDRSDGISLALTLERDTTDEDGRPLRGTVQRLKTSYFRGINGSNLAFLTLRAETQQFLPLLFSNQALAIRGYMSWIETNDADSFPFQRLMTNDDPDLFRGYYDFRWRSRGITALSAEYRWPVWAYRETNDLGADMYLFSDIGQVFDGFDDISRHHLTYSYGVGARIVGYRGTFVGRLEVGWSDEEVVLRLQADQLFQFAKEGLIHGRDQVALR